MKTDFTVLSFAPTGAVTAMHRENMIDLSILGPQEITRATDIRFCTAEQAWGIHFPTAPGAETFKPANPLASGFKSYEQARDVEVAWLEHARLHNVDPESMQGMCMLAAIRASLQGA